jgi:hypothetical protein
MTKTQVRIYNQAFNAEMAELSISECLRWNPHLTKHEAERLIARAKAATHRRTAGSLRQTALF